jgi:hypothetical protein
MMPESTHVCFMYVCMYVIKARELILRESTHVYVCMFVCDKSKGVDIA